MPPVEISSLKQYAVLWAPTGTDNQGELTFAATGVEVRVRWESGQREALDPVGNQIALDATVIVDRDMAVGSLLWEGRLSEYDAETSGPIMRVATWEKTPDIKGRRFTRSAGLVRFSDVMPTTEDY